jgi:hypothetical protein
VGVGTDKDKNLEKVELSVGHKILFQQLCKGDDQIDYIEKFDSPDGEDDDDLASVTSSTFGSDDGNADLILEYVDGPGECDGWGDMDQVSRDIKIGDSLKRLGNTRKQCISKHILCDMLGVDGDVAMVGVKKKREEKLRKEVRKLNVVYMSVMHFDRKMKKRIHVLKESLAKSKTKTFTRLSYGWRDKYDALMCEKRKKIA